MAEKTELSEKHKRFIEEYLVDLNGTQAAIRAGYSKHTAREQGSRLLSYAHVFARIKNEIAARSDRVKVTQDDVIRGLLQAIELAVECNDPKAATKAWELLGKHTNMFREHQEAGAARVAIRSDEKDALLLKVFGGKDENGSNDSGEAT